MTQAIRAKAIINALPKEHPAEFLLALLDTSSFGIIALDADAKVRLWSRGACAILGWTEEEVLGRPLPWAAGLLSLRNGNSEIGLTRNDNTTIEVSIWTASWQQGTLLVLVRNTKPEIQALMQREQDALAQFRAEQRFHELLEAAPDAIIEVNSEGHILTLNAATEQLFGYNRAELLGQPVETLVPEGLRRKHAGYRAGYRVNPVSRPMGSGLDLRGQRRDGSTFPVEISLSPVKSEDGFRVIAVIRDITKRKQTEDHLHAIQQKYTRELELSNLEIERATRHKSEFLANMSHELRTPLHTVIGFSELLAEEIKGPLNDNQRRFVGHIYKDSQHLLTLINEILDLSKVESGKLDLELETLDFQLILQDVLSALSPHAMQIETDIAPVFVLGDRTRVRQILYNLFSNALKFTPQGGRIWVEVDTAGTFAQISICDTGIGIPAEEHESVFRSFHQSGPTAGGVREGAGLGLSITKGLVEGHGGRIWLESAPGKGTRFTFTLPKAEPA